MKLGNYKGKNKNKKTRNKKINIVYYKNGKYKNYIVKLKNGNNKSKSKL